MKIQTLNFHWITMKLLDDKNVWKSFDWTTEAVNGGGYQPSTMWLIMAYNDNQQSNTVQSYMYTISVQKIFKFNNLTSSWKNFKNFKVHFR